MLSFLASFIFHLLCNEIKFPGRCTNPNPKHWHAWEGAMAECYSQDYSKYIGFWIAQMQTYRCQVQGHIMVPAALSLPKGEIAFTFPGFLWIMKSCPLLPRVKLLVKCDSVGGSFPLHFVCWVSFPLFCLAERAQV